MSNEEKPKKGASDDLADPQQTLREECKSAHCSKYVTRLDKCNKRVNSAKSSKETCLEEVIDVWHCIDHCASHSLFSKLK